jgi:hypothetical protein
MIKLKTTKSVMSKVTSAPKQVGDEKPTSHTEKLYQGAVDAVIGIHGRPPTASEERTFAEKYAEVSRLFRAKAILHGAKPDWLDVPRQKRTMVLRLLSEHTLELRYAYASCGSTKKLAHYPALIKSYVRAKSILIAAGYDEPVKAYSINDVADVIGFLTTMGMLRGEALQHAGRNHACYVAATFLNAHRTPAAIVEPKTASKSRKR